ncbi:heme exporter protein CcmD [Pseudoprimorskyibacter insulae]
MPELGKYAGTVLSAYGASIVLLVVLVAASWRRARKVKAALAKVENPDG